MVFSKVYKHISLRRWGVERPEAGVLEQTLWKSRWRASQAHRRTCTKVLMWELVKCLRKWKEASVTGVEWRVVRIVASGDFTGDCKHFDFTLSWELIWGCCLGKKMHNLTVESYVLFSGLNLKTSSPGDSNSSNSQILLRRVKRASKDIQKFLQQKTKWSVLMRKYQTSQINEFSALLCKRR